MRGLLRLLVLVAVVVGGYLLLDYYEIQGLGVLPFRTNTPTTTPPIPTTPVVRQATPETITVATWKLNAWGSNTALAAATLPVVAQVAGRFDILALQDVQAAGPELLTQLVKILNASGAVYDYTLSPRVGRPPHQRQAAFVFNSAVVELDRSSQYVIDDPDDLLLWEPFVAPFRVRGPPVQQAFTFTLVNVQLNPNNAERERMALAEVYRAVQLDGRQEDDVLLLGDLQANESDYGPLTHRPHIMWAVTGTTNDWDGRNLFDNLLFHQAATTEYTGRSGVLHTLKELSLTREQLAPLGSRFPLWGEFSAWEGNRKAP